MWWFINKIDHSPFFAKIAQIMLIAHDLGHPFFQRMGRYSLLFFHGLFLLIAAGLVIMWVMPASSVLAAIAGLIVMGCFLLLVWQIFWSVMEDFGRFWFHWEFIISFRAFVVLYLLFKKQYNVKASVPSVSTRNLAMLFPPSVYQELNTAYLAILQVLNDYRQITETLPPDAINMFYGMKKKWLNKELTITDVGCISGGMFTVKFTLRRQLHFLKIPWE